jgi:hypothetical protein
LPQLLQAGLQQRLWQWKMPSRPQWCFLQQLLQVLQAGAAQPQAGSTAAQPQAGSAAAAQPQAGSTAAQPQAGSAAAQPDAQPLLQVLQVLQRLHEWQRSLWQQPIRWPCRPAKIPQ